MPKPFETWTVLPHRPIEKLEENLWYVSGRMGSVQRMMAVARMTDGRLVIYNAIALDEAEMKELEAWGTPAFLVVPNAYHRVDAKIWKDRYPKMQVIAPAGGQKRVAQLLPVDRTDGDLGDPTVKLLMPECVGQRDTIMVVQSKRGTTLVFNDLVFNRPHAPGAKGLFFRLLGFTGTKPRTSWVMRALFVKNRTAFRQTLTDLAATPGLVRLIVSHGRTVHEGAADALRAAAATA